MYNEENQRMPSVSNDNPQSEQPVADKIARFKESAERANAETRADLTRLETRQHLQEEERESERKSRKRTSTALWCAVVLLAAGLISVSWYGVPLLRNHSSLLAQLPSLQESYQSLAQRADATEEQLRAWTSEQAGMVKRLTNIEKRVTANLQLARRESQQMATEVRQRMEAEINNRLQPMLARLGQVESNQLAEQARLEELRDEVNSFRQETGQQLAQLRQDGSRNFADLNQQIAWTKRDLDDLSKKGEFTRVDFEAAKHRSQELAPGISLNVNKTNVSYQRVDGWLQLVPGGKTVWVRGQGIEQPIFFFTQKESRPHALVFTRVSQNDSVGYLLIPAPAVNTAGTSSTSDYQISSAAPVQ